jgi:hypothetical protein
MPSLRACDSLSTSTTSLSAITLSCPSSPAASAISPWCRGTTPVLPPLAPRQASPARPLKDELVLRSRAMRLWLGVAAAAMADLERIRDAANAALTPLRSKPPMRRTSSGAAIVCPSLDESVRLPSLMPRS